MMCLAAATVALSVMIQNQFGTPKVLRFHGGADAAVSLQFDDSMISQLANALPLLNAREIRATFFVNTGSWQYGQHKHEWEVDVPKAGHELGNHTLTHKGAKTVEELAKEIADCSDQLAKVFGPKPRLVSFAIPGGVPWDFTPAQLNSILQKYRLVLATNRNFFDEQKTDPVTFVQHAIDTHSWTNVAMHGAGGEWLSTSIPNLTRLLDFIVAHRPALWDAPEIQVFKYTQERDAAQTPIISDASAVGFTVEVKCLPSKLSTFGLPIPTLYDEPLTIEVAVPDSWAKFQVEQGGRSVRYTVQTPQNVHAARFDILPNAGPAKITRQ